jgi:hypothetical protein
MVDDNIINNQCDWRLVHAMPVVMEIQLEMAGNSAMFMAARGVPATSKNKPVSFLWDMVVIMVEVKPNPKG